MPYRPCPTLPLPHVTVQVGNLRVTYSVHTHPGTDPGGNVKENQVIMSLKMWTSQYRPCNKQHQPLPLLLQ